MAFYIRHPACCWARTTSYSVFVPGGGSGKQPTYLLCTEAGSRGALTYIRTS
ncbi:hypothetical protein CGRA01v4_03829 [Colletotrichum graminicola]|nr:hypothetical protein CGRA01v4_03829 [Colletotrichum graminicola]